MFYGNEGGQLMKTQRDVVGKEDDMNSCGDLVKHTGCEIKKNTHQMVGWLKTIWENF